MRAQLESHLVTIEKKRPYNACRSAEEELESIGSFVYDELKEEPQIGDVYIRIFNKGGKDALIGIPNPIEFGSNLIKYVARCMNSGVLHEEWTKIECVVSEGPKISKTFLASPTRVGTPLFAMALNALSTLVRVDGLLDDYIAGDPAGPHTFLGLLELPLSAEVSI